MRPELHMACPDLETLLASGGDDRIALNDQGVNKYGVACFPKPGVLAYGSSTASTISEAGYAASVHLYKRLQAYSRREAPSLTYAREMSRVRGELITLCDLDSLAGLEVIFGASGTDVHLFAAQLFRKADSGLLVIMPEGAETGGGVPFALRGSHFSTRTALGDEVAQGDAIAGDCAVEAVTVSARFADGSLRHASLVDAEVESLAAQAVAAGRHVLLVLTDLTKTGLVVPSPACALALGRRFSESVDVLVDACQFRLAPFTLRAYLEQGFLLAVTGSKFVTGPAFCGALLVPADMAQRLRHSPLPKALAAYSARADWPQGWAAQATLTPAVNYGLLLRLEAALAELRAFHGLPEPHIVAFVKTFAAAVSLRIADDAAFTPLPQRQITRQPLTCDATWDHIPTIFPFLLRHPCADVLFNRDETLGLYESMQKDLSLHPRIPPLKRPLAARRCLLGQPVACGIRDGMPLSALRLNIDMRLIVDALSPGGRGGEAVIADALSVLDKAALLAECLF